MEEKITPNEKALIDAYLKENHPVTDWKREECPGCKTMRRFYCCDCLAWMTPPSNVAIPRITLPINVDIVMGDYRKRSTGIQAGIIAPDSVQVYDFPHNLPEWDVETSLVIYPSDDAITFDEMDVKELARIERFILLDCKWHNTKKILEHPSITRMTRWIKIKDPPSESKFWRYHHEGQGHLSSLEALYYMLQEYKIVKQHAVAKSTTKKDHPQQDALEDLFYLFRCQMTCIQHDYTTNERLKGYALPMEASAKHSRRWRVTKKLERKQKERERREAAAESSA